ncbi:MAG: 2-hydroxychromene-2-carboxylate isomerase [Burkholderiales bacterium]|nr:2-hydroxychromene-2-carboxylate isomerase [Burkholderiales bacterium]
MPAPVQFYFDFISPYGWFASKRVEDIARRHGREVDWNPMLLGVSVLKVMGLKPLLDTPLKGEYVRRDVRRTARKLGLALGRDLDAPIMNPLPAARALCWVKQYQPHLQAATVHAFYDACWTHGIDLSGVDAVLAHVPPGVDAARLTEAMAGDEPASLLRASVDASLAAGVFGSPTVVVDGEPFWGYERLPDVEQWLATGGW